MSQIQWQICFGKRFRGERWVTIYMIDCILMWQLRCLTKNQYFLSSKEKYSEEGQMIALCKGSWQTQRLFKCRQGIKISTCIVLGLESNKAGFRQPVSTWGQCLSVCEDTKWPAKRRWGGWGGVVWWFLLYFLRQLTFPGAGTSCQNHAHLKQWRPTGIFELGVKAEIKLNVEAWVSYRLVGTSGFIL